MKTSAVILCFMILFGLGQISQAQPAMITGEQGYKVNHDIKQCPEFMIKMFLDLSQQANPSVSKITFDVEYASADFQPKTTLPFTMYAQGTRYPNVSFRTDDVLGANEPELEARIKWWTFPSQVVKEPEREITNVTFLVGKGAPISWSQRFNFIQLYFKFLRAGAFKIGDSFPIHIKNVRVYVSGVNYSTVPDFVVHIKIEHLTSVIELPLLSENLQLSPNPTSNQVVLDFSLAEEHNQNLKVLISNSLGYQQSYPLDYSSSGIYHQAIDVTSLNSGIYWLNIDNGSGRTATQSLIIIR